MVQLNRNVSPLDEINLGFSNFIANYTIAHRAGLKRFSYVTCTHVRRVCFEQRYDGRIDVTAAMQTSGRDDWFESYALYLV